MRDLRGKSHNIKLSSCGTIFASNWRSDLNDPNLRPYKLDFDATIQMVSSLDLLSYERGWRVGKGPNL